MTVHCGFPDVIYKNHYLLGRSPEAFGDVWAHYESLSFLMLFPLSVTMESIADQPPNVIVKSRNAHSNANCFAAEMTKLEEM